MAVATEAGASERDFSDVDNVHAYSIDQAVKSGIASGCGNGRFCPTKPVSRAEMAVWLYRTVAHINDVLIPPPADEGRLRFSDMADDAWHGAYARWAVDRGVIAAPDGVFDPAGTVTRAEAAVMIIAAFEHLTASASDDIQAFFADTSDIPEVATRAIEGIYTAGLTKGCATSPLRYCPHQLITRAQTATMLTRAVQRAEFAVWLFANEPQAARGYTLFTPRKSENGFNDSEVYLIDHLGRIVHTWKLEGYNLRQVKLAQNGNLMIRSSVIDQGSRIVEIDRASNIVWEFTYNLFHDFLKLPNGNVLFIARARISPSTAIATGVQLEKIHTNEWLYDYLKEVKPTGPNAGEVVWEWSMLDHLIQDHDPTKPNYGAIAGHPELIDVNYYFREETPHRNKNLAHLNSIYYNPDLNHIMLSARNYSELWIINHNTTTDEAAGPKGDLLYRWGNPQAYGAGDYQDQQLFWAVSHQVVGFWVGPRCWLPVVSSAVPMVSGGGWSWVMECSER